MSSLKKSKKGQPKPSSGRPVSTALISQPAVEDSSNLYDLSSFSPSGDLFAYVSLAVDKHRLRIYNTTTGQAVADHVVDTARVSSLIWSTLGLSKNKSEVPQPDKKKRKKRESVVEAETKSKATEVVVLGLSDGTIFYFSPSQSRVLRSLSHSSSTFEILALAAEEDEARWLIWAGGADGALRLWDVNKNEIVGNWKNNDGVPYTALSLRYATQEDRRDILAASHQILLLSKPDTEELVPKKLRQLTTFTGHASLIKSMKWDPSQETSDRFISMAEADRFLYIWSVPDSVDSEGRALASIPLDSNARSFSVSSSQSSENTTLLALSTSGKISLYPVSHELPTSASTPSSIKLQTLLPRSVVISPTKKAVTPTQVLDASFINGEQGSIRVARLVRGIRPIFTVAKYIDKDGQFIQTVQLEDISDVTPEDTQPLITNKRYAESSIAVGSGHELGHDVEMDEGGRDIDGDLEVDLAELSLGQRLAATSNGDALASESEDEAVASPSKPKSSKQSSKSELDIVPANSLTRTLIQALHSSDTRLIETCLAHSNPDLICNTVRRLPSQLAIPLLNACVERLGRGARANNMKGGGGGASSQRGLTLITWIRTLLAVHTGHLMTVPDLVARLSGLHATLTARLALQENLLSLSGRLDMVLSQIEMRSSVTPAILAPKNKTNGPREKSFKRYVEGESESSDDEAQMDVEVEVGDDEASVEDIELGGDNEEDDDESDDDEKDSGEDSDGSANNEFIDDEAEEYSEDDDDDESD